MTFVAHVLEFFLIAGSWWSLGLVATFLVGPAATSAGTGGCCTGTCWCAASWPRWRCSAPAGSAIAGRATPEDLSRGAASRVRRRLRVAVEDAEIAVAHAESRDAPVAELPAGVPLAPTVADELDGLLKLERRLPAGASRADVRRQVAEVIGAARDVQAAAVRAGSDATEPQVRSLVRHASDEVDIVSTALASMRSVARPHWRLAGPGRPPLRLPS